MEPTELKGIAIFASAAMTERLEVAFSRLEALLVKSESENARLRRVEAAAAQALADLDVLLKDSAPTGTDS